MDVTTDQPLGSICACAQARGEGRRRRAGDVWAFSHALPRAPRKKGGEGVPWAPAAHRGFGTCCALLVGCRAVIFFKNGAGVALGWILLGKHLGKGEDVVLERRACCAVAPARGCGGPLDATPPDLPGPSAPASRPHCPWGSCAGGEQEKHLLLALQVMNLFLEKTSSPAWL